MRNSAAKATAAGLLLAVAACLYAPAARGEDDAPPPLIPAIKDGPEPAANPGGNLPAKFTDSDLNFVGKLLAREVARDISSPDAAMLRRIRTLIQAELASDKPRTQEEDNLYRSLCDELKTKEKTANRPAERDLRRKLLLLHVMREEWPLALLRLKELGPASASDVAFPALSAYVNLGLYDLPQAERDLQQAEGMLRGLRELRLSTPVLCDSIAGYRIYTPLPQGQLRPGDSVNVYAEISGAAFREAAGKCDYNLGFGLELRDDAQKSVWSAPEYGDDYKPSFRGEIDDLHVSIQLRLPTDLAGGRHHLFVTCRDNFTRKSAANSVSFDVSGPEATHSKPALPAVPVPAPAGANVTTPATNSPAAPQKTDEQIKALQDLIKKDLQRNVP